MDENFPVVDVSQAITLLALALVGSWDIPGKVIADSFLCLAEAGEDIPAIMSSLKEVRKALSIEPL